MPIIKSPVHLLHWAFYLTFNVIKKQTDDWQYNK